MRIAQPATSHVRLAAHPQPSIRGCNASEASTEHSFYVEEELRQRPVRCSVTYNLLRSLEVTHQMRLDRMHWRFQIVVQPRTD